jgi:outer membrane protein TolC
VLSAASDALTVEDGLAIRQALERRPDLEQARINVELQKVQLGVARAEYLPTIDAFLNMGYVGNVPDSRLSIFSDPEDPFAFTSQSNGYFSDAYWDRTMNVGFRLQWNLFDGLGSRRRAEQRKIAVDKARVDHEFLERAVTVEVERTLRDVRAAYQRMQSQERNVARAELNYSFAESRLREGVATPIEVREASSQLDQSRLNHLQAIHDYLVAQSAYETAVGNGATRSSAAGVTQTAGSRTNP